MQPSFGDAQKLKTDTSAHHYFVIKSNNDTNVLSKSFMYSHIF